MIEAAPAGSDGRPAREARAVAWWLVAWAVLVFAIVLVGGATRLTESGLSITEWKPVTGVVPPHTPAQWAEEFQKYQRIPQYQRLNAGMTLGEFKAIYLWEFWHRIVARLAGLAFFLPFLWFVLRRRIPPVALRRAWLLLALLALQGAMGWWMVSSGLSVRTEVSQYRLALHLTLAFILLGVTVWTAADLFEGPRARGTARRGARGLAPLVALVGLTSASGALVAGLRAGRVYNTFPLMAGRVVPPGWGQLTPWWRNLFENHAAVQFDHRVLALATFAGVVATWVARRGTSPRRLARRLDLALAAAVLQVALGIATLLLAVPIPLGVAHQGGAALLLVTVILAWHADRGETPVDRRSPTASRSDWGRTPLDRREPLVVPSERSESRDAHPPSVAEHRSAPSDPHPTFDVR